MGILCKTIFPCGQYRINTDAAEALKCAFFPNILCDGHSREKIGGAKQVSIQVLKSMQTVPAGQG